MKFDIVVAVDSLENVGKFVASLNNTGRAQDINLFLVCSNEINLNQLNIKSIGFADIKMTTSADTCGMRRNAGAAMGSAPLILFFADSIELPVDYFLRLEENINSYDSDVVAFESRMLPYETVQFYDPITLETQIADCNAIAIKRDFFTAEKGFDTRFNRVLSDADFCYRIASAGKRIAYMPECFVYNSDKNKNVADGYIDSISEILLLKHKFCTRKEILNGYKTFINALKSPVHFDNVRKLLIKRFLLQLKYIPAVSAYRYKHRKYLSNNKHDLNKIFSLVRMPYEQTELQTNPKVSVIVRTYNRSQFLLRALKSLKNQTYKNIEILVCEDGIERSKSIVLDAFPDLDIKYLSDGIQKGRSINGNVGLANATGEWCFFLDDDDYLYPEHIECMLSETEKKPEVEVVLGSAVAAFYDNTSNMLIRLEPMVFDRIDVFTMCQKCRIPIQTGMFRRELFSRCGGLEEGLDAHEDWAMWLKFYKNAKFSGKNSADVKRITSVFVQDANEQVMKKREESYAEYNKAFFNNENLNFCVTLCEMRKFYSDILKDVEHLYNNEELQNYLDSSKKQYSDK